MLEIQEVLQVLQESKEDPASHYRPVMENFHTTVSRVLGRLSIVYFFYGHSHILLFLVRPQPFLSPSQFDYYR
jgi:hypothetical protein